ncbi:MAG: outer membrane beta-barrel protein [Bacteroidetes bacterium]|nr:outer membrane beta-barrel protein [Bacteroidota bacterium]
MKKITIILFSVFFILSINTKVQAQLVSIGVGGGLTQVLGPDSYTDDILNGGLGFSSEYNFGIIAKVGLPVIPLAPRVFILYHKMNSAVSFATLSKGNDVSNIAEFSQSILSFGLGVQYGFIPVPVGFDPYLSLDVTFNNFGDFEGTLPADLLAVNGSRTGLQLGIGTEVTIIPLINLDVFAGYNWFNLTGKEDGEETVSAFVLDLFLMFNFL